MICPCRYSAPAEVGHSATARASAEVPSVRLTTVWPASASPADSRSSRAVLLPYTVTTTSGLAATAS